MLETAWTLYSKYSAPHRDSREINKLILSEEALRILKLCSRHIAPFIARKRYQQEYPVSLHPTAMSQTWQNCRHSSTHLVENAIVLLYRIVALPRQRYDAAGHSSPSYYCWYLSCSRSCWATDCFRMFTYSWLDSSTLNTL